jgi:hypothetical protein
MEIDSLTSNPRRLLLSFTNRCHLSDATHLRRHSHVCFIYFSPGFENIGILYNLSRVCHLPGRFLIVLGYIAASIAIVNTINSTAINSLIPTQNVLQRPTNFSELGCFSRPKPAQVVSLRKVE